MTTLTLDRDLAGSGPDGRWARFRVLDDAGRLVGFVTEWREWIGHTYGPSTYEAVHNPSGEAFRADWRDEGHPTPATALSALADHVAN